MALTIADAQSRQTIAAVYARISLDDQDTKLGVTRQTEDGMAECARRGWTPVLFIDNNISATNGKHRPEYRRMLRAIETGQVQAVVCWAADRLTRRPSELEEFIDVVNKAGAKVATCRSGDYDLSTPDGRMVARILGSIAKGEVEKMSSRMKRQRLQAAQQGLPNPGGRRPYGFLEDKISHHPVEAPAVRQAAQNLIDGVSLRSVTRELQFPTTVAFKRMITSPRMAGLRMAGAELVEAVWEPIIDRPTWETLRSILAAPQRHPGGVAARRYLLSGFLTCALCDARLQSNPTLGKRRYACPNDHVIRVATMLEEYVTVRVLAALESPELAEALQAGDDGDVDSKQLADEVGRLEARLREAKKAWLVEGLISKADFTSTKTELELRIGEIRRALAARAGTRMASTLPIGTGRIRAAWENGDLQQRRELIDVVVAKIVLRPAGKGARTFNPGTVDIHWRA